MAEEVASSPEALDRSTKNEQQAKVSEIGVSPKKKARKQVSGMASGSQPQVHALKSLVEAFSLTEKSTVDLMGFLVDAQSPKPVNKKSVMTLHVADTSAVVQVSVWSPICEKVATDIQKAYDGAPDGEFTKVVIKNLSVVVVDKGIVRMQSKATTTITFHEAGGINVKPCDSILTKSFANLGESGRGHILQGWLCELQVAQQSEKGNWMKGAKLVDPDGIALPLMFHGDHATDENLTEGCYLSIWWASSVEGLETAEEQKSGYFWVYQDRFILNGGEDVSVPKIHRVISVVWCFGCTLMQFNKGSTAFERLDDDDAGEVREAWKRATYTFEWTSTTSHILLNAAAGFDHMLSRGEETRSFSILATGEMIMIKHICYKSEGVC